jgi:hypothetical protein
MPGRAKFAHKEQIERRPERCRNFVRDRHATAWKRENDHVVASRVFPQRSSESPTSVTSILECAMLVDVHRRFLPLLAVTPALLWNRF